jgi:Tfp pilus assembly protein PilX
MAIWARIRRRLSAEHGFTMVTVAMSMMVLGFFAIGAWTAATGDIPLARKDQDHKRAYEAAQAGIQWYAYQLDRDPTYWTQCASVPAIAAGVPAPVNLEWNGTGTDPRVWRSLDTSGESYTIEILKKRDSNGNPTTACSTSDAVGTALQDNTLRIRATGKANGQVRSVIATFKRRSFMDFVYFTHSEAQDPLIGGGTSSQCSSQRSARGNNCTEITFVTGDDVNGPMHTNDSSVLVSGSPGFGRPGRNDVIEIAGNPPGYTGSGTPTFNGPKIMPAATLTPPPGNGALKTLAGPGGWVYNGQTCLVFKNNGTVDIYNGSNNWASSGRVTCSGSPVNRPIKGAGAPPNGVIYVANSTSVACSGTYTKQQRYQNTNSCGDVAVSGQYSGSITVAAENDIIVNANVTQVAGSDSMLGLVATGFVRVYHPIQGITSSSCGSTNSTPSGFVRVNRIDAAILSLNHSFMVDNYHCASSEGDLTVNGAIAQWYRGVVGTNNGDTGYIKNYNYDDRLKVREPPNFLDPVQTSWRIVRQTEQQPPTK